MNNAATAAAPITPAELDQLRNHLVLRPKDRKLWRDIGRDSVAKEAIEKDRDDMFFELKAALALAPLPPSVRCVSVETLEQVTQLGGILLRCMEEAADGAFANGNTGPTGSPDEGEVLTHARMDDFRAAIAELPKEKPR